MSEQVSTVDQPSLVKVREALEQCYDHEYNPIARFRIGRLLRNERAFTRFHQRVAERLTVAGAFDVDSILQFFLDHWDEILRIILAILPLFI